MIEILRLAPVIPVLVIQELAQAVPLARALVRGGLPVLEVTLRTPVALAAIEAIRAEVEGAVVGAGTVLTPAQVRQVSSAGGAFVVSPGSTPALLDAIADSGLPGLPGAVTASELMALGDRGVSAVKFFPAEAAGGVATLKALAGPFPHVSFCPTGGIDANKAIDYLALPQVACVGGSWMVPAAAVATSDWETLTRLAAQARALRAGGTDH